MSLEPPNVRVDTSDKAIRNLLRIFAIRDPLPIDVPPIGKQTSGLILLDESWAKDFRKVAKSTPDQRSI